MGQIAQSRGFDGDGNLLFGTGQVIPDDADVSGVEWEGAAPDEAPAGPDDGGDWQVADRRVFDAFGNLVAGVGDRYDAGQEGLVVEEVFVTGAGSPRPDQGDAVAPTSTGDGAGEGTPAQEPTSGTLPAPGAADPSDPQGSGSGGAGPDAQA